MDSERATWDWRPLMYELLALEGLQRLTEYAQRRPTATLELLCERLGARAFQPCQLRESLVEEAFVSADMEACARDLLVRAIHSVPNGWPRPSDENTGREMATALHSWTTCLNDSTLESVLKRIVDWLLAQRIHTGWKPSGSQDPLIASAFDREWPRPSQRGYTETISTPFIGPSNRSAP